MASGIAGGVLASPEISPVGLELCLAGLSLSTWKDSFWATATSSVAAPGQDSSAAAISPAWSKEMSPCCSAALSSADVAKTLPVETKAFAFPIEVPVTLASSEASSSLRERPVIPKSTNLRARA